MRNFDTQTGFTAGQEMKANVTMNWVCVEMSRYMGCYKSEEI